MHPALPTHPTPMDPLCLGPEDHDTPVGRRALLDRKRRLVGYELYPRATPKATPLGTDHTLINALANGGKVALVGRKAVFVPCSDQALHDERWAHCPAEGVVLMVQPPPGLSASGIDQRAPLLAALRQRGFCLAFEHAVLGDPFAAWLPLASYVMLDLAQLQPAALGPLVQRARPFPHLHLIARGVHTVAQFNHVHELGVHLFEGDWLNQPVPTSARTLRPSQATILQLIHLLRDDGDIADIEEVLKRDPTLSFNLLRYINSSGFGLSCEITSFRHAAMIIGQKNLFRWAALLLTVPADGSTPPAVGTTAIVRCRLTELLAAELLPPEECDNAFIVGVFSLLDAMLGVPMARALQELPLPETVTDALLEQSGPYAPFLQLAVACERGDDEGFAKTAQSLQLSNHQINWAHLQALTWADALAP